MAQPATSRRQFLVWSLRAAAGTAAASAFPWIGACAAVGGGSRQAATRYNVLFIAVDDLRPELGCYGHRVVKSPNVDGLAATGTLFARAYCQQAVCAPSRASLLSGCRPDTTRIYDLKTPLRKAMPNVLSLPQHFKNHGYHTVSLGKIYHHGSDDAIGWSERPRAGRSLYADDKTNRVRRQRMAEGKKQGMTGSGLYNYAAGPATECLDVPDNAYGDGAIADAAIQIMRRRKNETFFLAVGFWKPHLPFTAPKRYWDRYDRAAIPLPDTTQPADAPRLAMTNWAELRAYSDIPANGDLDEAKTRQLIHGYYACVTYMDTQVGRLLNELDRLALADHTVVVLWGDHGWKLGEYADWCKHTNFELDTHVPMLLRVPGTKGGQVCHRLTEFVDIYPTLAEVCGLPIPAHCEGVSMAPLLAEPDRPWKTASFSQYPRRRVMGYSLRTERWRYTEWIDRNTKTVVARELYDHAKGPFARANVVARPEHADLVARLAKMMKKGWQAARPPAT